MTAQGDAEAGREIERSASQAPDLSALGAELDALEARLAEVREALARFVPDAARPGGESFRAPRGGLTKSIVELLQKAGPEGVPVKTIASSLSRTPGAIHVWFHTTGRAFPEIRKTGRGIYAWSK